jgi:aminopeptidase N
MQQSVRRLIKGFRPSHYDLSLTQDSATLSFSGIVKTLAFHSDSLLIAYVMINRTKVTYALHPDSQELELTDTSIPNTELEIEIRFNGEITRPMHGLYPCFFNDGTEEKALLATQFESHHAREVLPCIDEPEAKATFQLHLTTSKKDVHVSNTPIEIESIKSGLKTTTFEITPIMSTYLLAWVSGDLVYDEATSTHGISVKAYTTPVHKGKTAFALNVATKALDYLDDYFGIPYPLKKYDILALPDFAAAAMENWGLVTYREGSMLIDEMSSDLSDKQHVANVTIHEISHQWFGNLVTMRWWNDLWLNEGFASWIPYIVTDELFPDWNIWEQFASDDLAIGLRADALQNTHPIVVEINSPEEIRSAFDSISYDKGCAVINLVYNYIGKDAFRRGLQNYLKKHSYDNAETKDLWKAWSEASGKDVLSFMQTWTEASGFPLLKASSDGENLHVEQMRFFLNPAHDQDDTCWPVPLMRSSSDTELLELKSSQFDLPSKLNAGQSGFYRVIYSGQLKTDLQHSLESGKLAPLDALGIISDASEASKAGYQSSTEALALIQYLSTTSNESLLSSALGEIAEYRSIFTELYSAFKPYVAKLISPNLERLGIELKATDTVDDELLRPVILASAAYTDNQEVIRWAVSAFEKAESPNDLRSDVRSVIYQIAMKNNLTTKTYEKLLRWYFETTIPGEQMSLAASLCGVDDKNMLHRSLDLITAGEIRLQDARFWIAYSLRNRTYKHLAWQWIQSNWQWIGDNYGQEKEIDYFLRYCASGFATEGHYAAYTTFFTSANMYGSERAFEQGKETILWQSSWRQRDSQIIEDWLRHL